MKKVLIVSLLVLMSALFSQNTATSEDKKGSEVTNRNLSIYGPSFYDLKVTDKNVEMDEYATIKNILKDTEQSYMKRLIVLMDSIKVTIDNKTNYTWEDHEFSTSVSYFNQMISTLRGNINLYNGIKYLDVALKKFITIRPAIEANGISKEELDLIEFKIKKYHGMFHMFSGITSGYLNAIEDFEYIISKRDSGDPLVKEDEHYIEIFTYLAGVRRQMMNLTVGVNTAEARKHLRRELYSLWNLTSLKNKGNDKLIEYKYMKLIKKYYDVLDPDSATYQTLYKPYVDKLALEYVNVEKKASGASTTTNK